MLHQVSYVTACSIQRAVTLKFFMCVDYCNSSIKLVYHIHVAGNFRVVQIFAYFEHIQIVQELELAKLFTQDYPILSHTSSFVCYAAPDVTVSMVASYHCLDGERSMQHEWNSLN